MRDRLLMRFLRRNGQFSQNHGELMMGVLHNLHPHLFHSHVFITARKQWKCPNFLSERGIVQIIYDCIVFLVKCKFLVCTREGI